MRGGVRSALVRGLGACCAALALLSCPTRPAEATFDGIGLAEVLGPGAAGLAGEAARASGNPALLAHVPFADASLGAGLQPGTTPWQRIDLVWPALRGDAVAIAVLRQVTDGSVALAGALAYGRGVGAGFDIGGTVELRTNEGGTASGFGLNAGVAYSPHGPAGMSFGVHVRDVARSVPTVAAEPETRRLEVGIAQRFQLSRDWRGTATAGFEAVQGASGAAWLGARVAWRDRFQLAGAGTQDQGRAGAGLRCGTAWLEYALEGGADVRHSVGVRVTLGAPVETRRTAAAAWSESLLASRVASVMAAREQRAIETRLADAEAALASAECERASELFREVLLWSPDHAGARDGLARALRGALFVQADSALVRGDWRRATDLLEHASRLFPDDSLTIAKLADVRGAAHRADRTRSEASEQVRLGLEAYTQQRWAVAARSFEAALRLDPANEVAGEFLPRARTAGDTQIAAAIDQARTRLGKRDPTGARAALADVVSEPPLRTDVQQLVADIERETERLADERRAADAREREVAAREDRSPPPVTRARLRAAYDAGLQHYRAGDLPAALEAWEGVARQAPHFEEVDRYLLRVYRVVGLESYTEGRLQAAIDLWTKALTLEPENPQVRRYLDQANAKLQRAHHPRGSR